MKLTTILIILLVISLAGGAFFFSQYQNERKDRIRNQTNVEILANEFKQFKDSSEAKNRVLIVNNSEFQRAFSGLKAKLESMNIKLKDVDLVTTSEIVVNQQPIKLHIKDSLVTKIDTIPLEYATYKDSFRDLEIQRIEKDLYITRDITRVPLIQIVHRQKQGEWKPKNIFPWNWRRKKLIQTIKSDNPNAKIEFSRTIKIEK